MRSVKHVSALLAAVLVMVTATATRAQGPSTSSAALVPGGATLQQGEDVQASSVSGTLTYHGRLLQNGNAVTGNYDFWFVLCDAENGGNVIELMEKRNVSVSGGVFSAELNFGQAAAWNGDERWLEVQVRRAGSGNYTFLTPRQKITEVPYASLAKSLPEQTVIRGQAGQFGSLAAMFFDSNAGHVRDAGVWGGGGWGVYGYGTEAGVMGLTETSGGNGVKGSNLGLNGHGVYADSMAGGVDGSALYADSRHSNGVAICANAFSTGTTLMLRHDAGSGDLIRAVRTNPEELRFRVDTSGNVYADGQYRSPAADVAEMLPAAETLEAGDVLSVAADGRLVRSAEAFAADVVGVHSTQAAFLGGAAEETSACQVPLAVSGIVPVKACDENGPIVPGDLLVASSLPGRAMRGGTDPPAGTVIGKALQGLAQGSGVIRMLVMLR